VGGGAGSYVELVPKISRPSRRDCVVVVDTRINVSPCPGVLAE
jgi:hypothetical protein